MTTDENEKADVSNTTVAVLLIMTILVTLVGTWLVLDATFKGVAAANAQPPQNEAQARVSLTLVKPPIDQQTAHVVLEIKKK